MMSVHWLRLGVFKTEPIQKKIANRTNPNRNRKKLHLVRVYWDHFFLLNRMVWFGLRF